MPDQDHTAIRDALRAEAAGYWPDHASMLARVERGMAEEARPAPRRRRFGRARRAAPRRSGLRLTGTAVAISCVLGLSVAGTWAAVGRYNPPEVLRTTEPGATSPASTPDPTSSSSASAGARTGSATATPSAPASGALTRVEQGFLWSDGSVDKHSTDYWAQSDVTVKNQRTSMTSLDVKLWVALTPGVTSTGAWSTLPNQDMVATVTPEGGGLLYEWKLKAGVTVEPGTYEFAAQYNHASGGRNAGQDTYRARAAGQDGSSVEVWGNFYGTH